MDRIEDREDCDRDRGMADDRAARGP